MSSIPTVHALCFPPLGKPAKDADYTLGENRPRVPQSPQKEGNCWFYALNIAGRERYGKTAPMSLAGRANEKAVSDVRKGHSKLDKRERELEVLIQKIQFCVSKIRENGANGPITHETVRLHLSYLPTIIVGIVGEAIHTQNRELAEQKINFVYEVKAILEGFLQQSEAHNLEEYPKYLRNALLHDRIQLLERHLNQLGVPFDIEKEHTTTRKAAAIACAHQFFFNRRPDQYASEEERSRLIETLFQSSSTESIGIAERYAILRSLVHRDSYQRLGFKEASWNHPSSSFESLTESLKKHGPHVITGYFGLSYYEVLAKELPASYQAAESRKIYGWSANDPHYVIGESKTGIKTNHSVVVIGTATISGKPYIYFLDPRDGTDPNDPSSQKVYMISYERLIQNIRPFQSYREELVPDPDIRIFQKMTPININLIPASSASFTYAVYYPHEKP